MIDAPTAFRPGDVLRYEERRRPGDVNYRWCREEIAIVDDRGIAYDTYWSGSDQYRLHPAELATARVIANLGDYTLHSDHDRMTDEALHAGMADWQDYRREDRLLVTRQHGHTRLLYVRIGAQPDRPTMIANAQAALDDAQAALRSAERTVQRRREDLARLRAGG